jgi:hypothetical protein
MKKLVPITIENGKQLFNIEIFNSNVPISHFDCRINEYNDYLTKEAWRSQNDHIALTWYFGKNQIKVLPPICR